MFITSFLRMRIEFSMIDFWRVLRKVPPYEIRCFKFFNFHKQFIMQNVYLMNSTLWVVSIFWKVIPKKSVTFSQ